MNKFDKLYKNIKNKISIIVEDFNIKNTSSFLNNQFDFKKDEDNNIICTFSIKKNENNQIVIAKIFNNEISFLITNQFGKTSNLSEKEFATNYYKDYNEFKKALDDYLKSGDLVEADEKDSKIKTLNDEIENQEYDDKTVKEEKIFEINNSKFIFRLLNDISVENYCECIFDFQDESNDTIYIRALLNILKKNSVIIKLLVFNEEGELMEKMTKTEFMNKYNEKYKELVLATKKMELFVAEQI